VKLKASDRPRAGFIYEDSTARSLKRRGHKVKQMPRNAKYDLNVNGTKVEVKAAVKTKYKGSDGYPIEGYVFSNMKKNPKNDKYILKCLSPDRKRTLKTYEIPSRLVKQKTLTITDNGKYEKFRKSASLRRAARRLKYETVGSLTGAALAMGPEGIVEAGRSFLGLPYREESVNFSLIVRGAVGATIGRYISSNILRRKQHEERRRENQQRRGIRAGYGAPGHLGAF